MDRREFLRVTGAAAAAATGATAATAKTANHTDTIGAAPVATTGIKELRLAMPWPDAVSGPADQAHRLAQRIEAMSSGRYRIQFLPGIEDGLAAVERGDADIYHGTEHDHLGAHRALAYFAGLPGERGIAPHHLVSWITVGGGQSLWDEIAGEFGVKPMLAGHAGALSSFLATRRIESMSDLASEKVAVMGLAHDVVRGFGLTPVTMPAGHIATALSQGDILAAECGGALTSHALGVVHAAPYAAGTSINRNGIALSFGMRRSLWDNLDSADQAMFTAASAAEVQLALAEDDAQRRLLMPAAPADKTWPIAKELDRAIRRVSDAVVAHVAGSDAHAQRINASYVTFRRLALGEDVSAQNTVA